MKENTTNEFLHPFQLLIGLFPEKLKAEILQILKNSKFKWKHALSVT
jgi:hypothetical protein